MRILVMGTGPFAVPTFQWLLASPHEVPALITRPARPAKGRRAEPVSPMRSVAQQHGLAVHDPESINAPPSLDLLRQFEADLFLVCDFGQILSREALSLAALGGINLHGSLLPKYRGAAPVNWALLRGETDTGVTVIHMTPRLDGGPCLVQRSVSIGSDETAAELESRLAILGVESVAESLAMLENWDGQSPLGQPQDPTGVTSAPRLSKAQGEIDWSRTAEEIRNQLRALQPWPGVYTQWSGKKQPLRLILNWVSVVPGETSTAEPATVVARDAQRLWVATGGGVIAIERIQPAGKRPMEIAEFLRGHPIEVGDRFESSLAD